MKTVISSEGAAEMIQLFQGRAVHLAGVLKPLFWAEQLKRNKGAAP